MSSSDGLTHAAEINAVALILGVATTAVVIAVCKTRAYNHRKMLSALVLTVILAGAALSVHTHKCRLGLPVMQCIIPSGCASLVFVFVIKKTLRFGLSIALYVAAWLLAPQYIRIVHSGHYIGNRQFLDARNEAMLVAGPRTVARELLSSKADRARNYEAGWLRDSEIVLFLVEEDRAQLGVELWEAVTEWHSPVTGLHRKVGGRKLQMWYPGGKVADGVRGIEFR